MQLVVMSLCFEMVDNLLPVCCQYISIGAMEALIDLDQGQNAFDSS
jgi:hypothetical protein